MDPTDLNDSSLLVLCDVAAMDTGRRQSARIATLLNGAGGSSHGILNKGVVPGCVDALVKAGLVTVRRSTPRADRDAKPGWTVEITDKGQLLHRCLVAALRNASVFTEAAKA
jgi:hypothetical protein